MMFDRIYREFAETGVMMKPRRGNSKAIARVSPYSRRCAKQGRARQRLKPNLAFHRVDARREIREMIPLEPRIRCATTHIALKSKFGKEPP